VFAPASGKPAIRAIGVRLRHAGPRVIISWPNPSLIFRLDLAATSTSPYVLAANFGTDEQQG
jgi:hypothetical protein